MTTPQFTQYKFSGPRSITILKIKAMLDKVGVAYPSTHRKSALIRLMQQLSDADKRVITQSFHLDGSPVAGPPPLPPPVPVNPVGNPVSNQDPLPPPPPPGPDPYLLIQQTRKLPATSVSACFT